MKTAASLIIHRGARAHTRIHTLSLSLSLSLTHIHTHTQTHTHRHGCKNKPKLIESLFNMSVDVDSATAEQEVPLVVPDASLFTCDGTVNFRSRPALRACTGSWAACSFFIGYEIIDRLAYFGVLANLVLYIKNELHEGTVSATKSVNYWKGSTLVLPILGAFLADSYLGRFRTIACLSAFYVLGLIMLTLSASLKILKPETCTSGLSCPKATSAQLAFFYISLYLIAIGTAGVKPCLEAFGPDQFDDGHPSERKNKSSFFNWWYFGIGTGSLLAFTVIVYIEDNASSGLGYGILAILITLAYCVFLVGTPLYRNKIPGGSSIVGIFQVFVAVARKWHVKVPDDHLLLYEVQDKESLRVGRMQLSHTSGFRCLDKAATVQQKLSTGEAYEQASIVSDMFSLHSDFKDGIVNPWDLCTVTQVEEVKLILRIIPIWLTTIVHGMISAQTETFFVQQAATMDREVGLLFTIPSASLLSFSSVAILVMLLIYDRMLVPIARGLTGCERGITILQRQGVGYFLSIMCMMIAALVESRRLQAAKEYGLVTDPNATIPMSVFWLVPQYLLYGISCVFALVGEQEFFYGQMPDSMQSLGMSIYLCANGLSEYVSNALISVVNVVTSRAGNQSWIEDNLNSCHLDYYYWFLACLFTLNLVVFIALSRLYTYKEVVKST